MSTAKFKIGQVVFDKNGDEIFVKILDRAYDRCDGWEYDIGDRAGDLIVMRLEEQLRPLTRREKGNGR